MPRSARPVLRRRLGHPARHLPSNTLGKCRKRLAHPKSCSRSTGNCSRRLPVARPRQSGFRVGQRTNGTIECAWLTLPAKNCFARRSSACATRKSLAANSGFCRNVRQNPCRRTVFSRRPVRRRGRSKLIRGAGWRRPGRFVRSRPGWPRRLVWWRCAPRAGSSGERARGC